MSGGGGGERRRTIKLYCPSLSATAIVPFTVSEEERLDLGSIARTFGIDPATLKLNGHFISRGVDLIASSVTWKSLLSFFSARGLATGNDDRNALLVDGKLCKAGSKRSPDPRDIESGSHSMSEHEVIGVNYRGSQLESSNLIKKKRLRESSVEGCEEGGLQVPYSSTLGFKRKKWSEDFNTKIKKLKMTETILGT